MSFKTDFDALPAEDLPTFFELAAEQPYGVEFYTADGVGIKEMHIPKAGTYVPQHSHVYGHTSLLALGSVRVWQDDRLIGDFEAPKGIFIPAGVKHKFLSLVDETIVYCIHNTSRTGKIEVQDEHHIVG
jgi:quercetin dioxygenase-like cupin family protein